MTEIFSSPPTELPLSDSNRRAFNSFPIEIIEEVLCNIDSRDLFSLKSVCSYWYKIIHKLLDIKGIPVSAERFANAVNLYVPWKQCIKGQCIFSVLRAAYSIKSIISKAIVSKHIKEFQYGLQEVPYTLVLDQLKYNARWGGTYSSKREDVMGSLRRTILGMTEIQYSLEELRDKGFEDEMVKSSMSQYTWYCYVSESLMQIAWDAGFIALYPDNRTFSVLFATDTN